MKWMAIIQIFLLCISVFGLIAYYCLSLGVAYGVAGYIGLLLVSLINIIIALRKKGRKYNRETKGDQP